MKFDQEPFFSHEDIAYIAEKFEKGTIVITVVVFIFIVLYVGWHFMSGPSAV